jgi:selenocysteine lyase/cysteine desulfurase
MLGSMATLYLPVNAPNELDTCTALRDKIYDKYALEVPIFPIQGRGALRVSAQLYSAEEDIERLVAAISSIGIFE